VESDSGRARKRERERGNAGKTGKKKKPD